MNLFSSNALLADSFLKYSYTNDSDQDQPAMSWLKNNFGG